MQSNRVKHQAAKNEAKHGTIGCKVKKNGKMHALSIGQEHFYNHGVS
jgi:ribosomal protein S3